MSPAATIVDVGAGPGHGDAGAAQGGVDLPGLDQQLLKDISAPGNEQLNSGHGPVQLRGDLDELPGHQGPVLIHPADVGDNGALGVQAELGNDPRAGNAGGELLRVDAVDGDGDVIGGKVVLPDEVGLDVVGHRDGALPPVGEVAQDTAGVKDPVGGGDEGEVEAVLESAAQKGGDAGVGVDHVRLLLENHVPKDGPGAEHIPEGAPVHGGVVVPDAGGGDFRDVDASVGHHHHIMSLVAQLLGQLHNVGFRSADVQTHGGHQDFHGTGSFVPVLCQLRMA